MRHSNNLILAKNRTKSIDNENYDEKEEKKTEADSDSDPKKVNYRIIKFKNKLNLIKILRK